MTSKQQCPECHAGQWYSKNGPTGAQETCKNPWHEEQRPSKERDIHGLCNRLAEVFNTDDTPDELSTEAREAIEELWQERDALRAEVQNGKLAFASLQALYNEQRAADEQCVPLQLMREAAEGLRHNAAIFRDLNQRSREQQLLFSAENLCQAADEIERLQGENETLHKAFDEAARQCDELRSTHEPPAVIAGADEIEAAGITSALKLADSMAYNESAAATALKRLASSWRRQEQANIYLREQLANYDRQYMAQRAAQPPPALETIAATLQQWLDFHACGTSTPSDDATMVQMPVYPTRRTVKAWVAAIRASSPPSDDLYALLVRRGYAQHEAHAIAFGDKLAVLGTSEPPRDCLCDEARNLLLKMSADHIKNGCLSGRMQREGEDLLRRLDARAASTKEQPRRFCCFEDCDQEPVMDTDYCAGHREQEFKETGHYPGCGVYEGTQRGPCSCKVLSDETFNHPYGDGPHQVCSCGAKVPTKTYVLHTCGDRLTPKRASAETSGGQS